MAGFLRKKSKDPQVVKHPERSPPPNGSSATVAPLFARFATTQDPAVSQRIVSSPMLLSGAARRDPLPKLSNGTGAVFENRVTSTFPRPEQRLDAQSGYVTGSYAPSRNGAEPRHQSLASQAQPNPTNPSPRRLSRIPAIDKPLPIQPTNSDPLSIAPPQSFLPASRRISTHGLPTTYQNGSLNHDTTPLLRTKKSIPQMAPSSGQVPENYSAPGVSTVAAFSNSRSTNILHSDLAFKESNLPSSNPKVPENVPSSYSRQAPTAQDSDLTSRSPTSRQDLHPKRSGLTVVTSDAGPPALSQSTARAILAAGDAVTHVATHVNGNGLRNQTLHPVPGTNTASPPDFSPQVFSQSPDFLKVNFIF